MVVVTHDHIGVQLPPAALSHLEDRPLKRSPRRLRLPRTKRSYRNQPQIPPEHSPARVSLDMVGTSGPFRFLEGVIIRCQAYPKLEESCEKPLTTLENRY